MTQKLLADTLSNSTKKAYNQQLRKLEAFLVGDLNDNNLSEALAARIAEHENATGRVLSVSALTITLAAVKQLAKLAGAPNPVGASTQTVLAAHRRRATQPRQAKAVTYSVAKTAAQLAASEGTNTGLRDSAIIAIASDCLLRVSEVVAIDVDDITYNDDATATLTVKKSKTDQTGRGAVLAMTRHATQRVKTWLSVSRIVEGAVFVRIRRGDNIKIGERLSSHAIRSIIKRRAVAAGVDGASGHSLRVGTTQSLVKRGATLSQLQQAGRWASPRMPAHYARHELAGRGAVARLLG